MNPHEYDVMYNVEDTHWWYRGLRALLDQYWREHVRVASPKVLDSGCGTGAVLDWVAAHGGTAFGLDLSPLAVGFCRKRGRECTAIASVEALPVPSESFDAAVSFDVLYHRNVKRKDAPLREIHRTLKPGGLLFLNLPAYQWLYSPHDMAVHTDHRFTRPEVLELLRSCSFTPLECTYWNTLLFAPIVLARLWRKRLQPSESDLMTGGELADRTFSAAFSIERNLIRLTPLPFGLSIFAVAQKE